MSHRRRLVQPVIGAGKLQLPQGSFPLGLAGALRARPLAQFGSVAVEVQQIMAQEEMTSHPWRWEDGLVPQAMRQG